MSEEQEWDTQWWRKEKAASLERKRHLSAYLPSAKPGDAFLIVTEGEVTEPVYFELLVREIQLPAVRVKVQPGEASDPRHVIRTAAKEAKAQDQKARSGQLANNEPSKFDHVWAIIDTDVAVRTGIWNEVQQLAQSLRVSIAHSTPCFEFWLLLHICGYTTRSDLFDGARAKAAVEEALGKPYSTNKEVAAKAIRSFIGEWPKAVDHAERVREHHESAGTAIPCNPSTEVGRLARAMNDSAPAHLRKL